MGMVSVRNKKKKKRAWQCLQRNKSGRRGRRSAPKVGTTTSANETPTHPNLKMKAHQDEERIISHFAL